MRSEVENPMVSGAGFPQEIEPNEVCPHCGAEWYDNGSGGYESGPHSYPTPLTFSGRYCMACASKAIGTHEMILEWFDSDGNVLDFFGFFLGDRSIVPLNQLSLQAGLVVGLLREHEPDVMAETLWEYVESWVPDRRSSWMAYLWANG